MQAPPLWLWCLYIVICLLGNHLALSYARWRQIVDLPGGRRNHAVPTPRGGGAGIAVSVLLGMTALPFYWPHTTNVIGWLGGALVLVAGVGWWDDHRPLPSLLRLAVHLVAALCVAAGLAAYGYPPAWCLLSLVVVPMGINLWNFMDGINGLVTSQVALYAGFLAWFCAPSFVQGAALLVVLSAAAFLPLNFPRARIFLGDVGSGALGLMVAVLWLFAAGTGPATARLAVMLPLFPLLIDSVFTLLWRIWKRQPLLQPHTEHLYQRAVRHGRPHWKVTLAYAAVTSALVLSAMVVSRLPLSMAVITTTLLALGCVIAWMIVRSRLSGGTGR